MSRCQFMSADKKHRQRPSSAFQQTFITQDRLTTASMTELQALLRREGSQPLPVPPVGAASPSGSVAAARASAMR